MSMSVKFDVRHAANMAQRIDLMILKPAAKQKVFENCGRAYLKASRDHIRQQKTIDGRQMAPKKYGKGKVLKKMGQTLKFDATSKQVTLTWPNKSVAKLASRHQFGIEEVMTANRMVKIHGQPNYADPATKKQAKALIDAGFVISTGKRFKSGTNKGKMKKKRPSQKWITENMRLGQAGLIIRTLRNQLNRPKRWDIPVPARPFLGMENQEAAEVLTKEILKERQRRAR